MENIWLHSAIWIALALLSSLISVRLALSVALVEIVIGAFAGNLFDLRAAEWINYLGSVGAILLTFLAGAEIDPAVIKKHFGASVGIGAASFAIPYLGVLLFAHYAYDWPWGQAQIAGLSLSTTSVAVTFAVLLESGQNRTELGKIILAACFITDIGTVVALGVIFANYNMWLFLFAVMTALVMWVLPRFVPWYFRQVGNRISEPETKFILLILFFLGWLSSMARSEAVLPAYLIGMVLAPYFLQEKVLAQRMRVMAFTLLTPFYFLKAGSLIKMGTVSSAVGLIAVLLSAKMITKFVGILPLSRKFLFSWREGIYTTLLMSTGLTFGSICALFGLTNGIINQDQYTVLLTAVIGSAVVPTLIAQRWFQPPMMNEEEDHAEKDPSWP
ncbi:MAG: cation:proton antiporter [Syntrophaceae bacterium]|nr:cation:proton antiporter [Syntrophaceae bacterium]